MTTTNYSGIEIEVVRGGGVAASLDETTGTWSWLDDSEEARAVARGERVASVFVEAA